MTLNDEPVRGPLLLRTHLKVWVEALDFTSEWKLRLSFLNDADEVGK